MSRNKINLKNLLNEKNIKSMFITGEIIDLEEEYVQGNNNFQKIKHKPKHSQNEINEFQSRKRKLNHTKRGK